MIETSCHCGAVRLHVSHAPDSLTDCNCSICRRYGALWAYYSPKDVQVGTAPTDIYMWGERTIEFHRCRNCGNVSHWLPADRTVDRMGINARLMDPHILAGARVRRFDGADTWKELDP